MLVIKSENLFELIGFPINVLLDCVELAYSQRIMESHVIPWCCICIVSVCNSMNFLWEMIELLLNP